jgi:hypothetical protein
MGKGARVSASDVVFPGAVTLPLCERAGGVVVIDHVPGLLRPFSATLGVSAPPSAKKHDTTASRWKEKQHSQTSKDGKTVTDTVEVLHTDS